MAEAGPYRVRLDQPESGDGFWKLIRRQRRWRRALPWIIAFLALAPGIAVIVGGGRTLPRSWLGELWGMPDEGMVADDLIEEDWVEEGTPQASVPEGATSEVGKPSATPWGFSVSFNQVNPWLGPLPPEAARPSINDSPIAAEDIQAAVRAQGSELRDCYLFSEAHESGRVGVLIASILIRRNGEVEVAIGGDEELGRMGVSACVAGALKRLRFPPPDPNFGWVHLPLRFAPAQ